MTGKTKTSWLIALLLLGGFVWLSLFQIGSAGYTLDERADQIRVSCYVAELNPFKCFDDPTQARLPYYIHAAVEYITPESHTLSAHHLISVGFTTLAIFIFFVFAQKEYGRNIGLLSLALSVSSIPLITTSRGLLTASNALFLCATVAFLITFYYSLKTKYKGLFLFSGLLFGVAAGTSLLSVLTILPAGLLYVALPAKRSWSHLAWAPLAAIGFFSTSITHADPSHLLETILLLGSGVNYYYWNIFSLGTTSAPWWYSFLVFGVKTSPWLFLIILSTPTFIRWKHKTLPELFLGASYLFILSYLFLKSSLFDYGAPHQQVHLLPLAYLLAAIVISRFYSSLSSTITRILTLIVVGGMFVMQLWYIGVFHPQYTFFGAQYGEAYIGEIYGPATLHCQGYDDINKRMRELQADGNTIIFQNESCIHDGVELTRFSDHQLGNSYDYAFLDHLHGHLRFDGRDSYETYVKNNCEPFEDVVFPTNFTIATLYSCKK